MSKNPLTNCGKYNQCYFLHSIKGLIDLYKDYSMNMNKTDVRLWEDFQRGAHHSRIALADNIVDDLKDVLETLDPELNNSVSEYVTL